MKSIDQLVLRLLNNQSTIDYLKESNVELKKAAFDNYYWLFIKKALFGWGMVGVGALITLLFTSFIAPINSAEPSTISNLANSMVAPSITMTGLFITFTPVIAFFFLSELKDAERESKDQTARIKAQIFEEEDEKALVELHKRERYESAFFHNFRTGIIKYVGTYLSLALASLLLLFFAYTLLNQVFLLIAVFVAVGLLVGIIPIVTVAFNKAPLTLVTLFSADREPHEIITYDD